jgi:hypothetical protein
LAVEIVNWEAHQEDRRYKGGLPWVKLMTDTVLDKKVRGLSEEARWQFLGLLCLAGGRDRLRQSVAGEDAMRVVTVNGMGLLPPKGHVWLEVDRLTESLSVEWLRLAELAAADVGMIRVVEVTCLDPVQSVPVPMDRVVEICGEGPLEDSRGSLPVKSPGMGGGAAGGIPGEGSREELSAAGVLCKALEGKELDSRGSLPGKSPEGTLQHRVFKSVRTNRTETVEDPKSRAAGEGPVSVDEMEELRGLLEGLGVVVPLEPGEEARGLAARAVALMNGDGAQWKDRTGAHVRLLCAHPEGSVLVGEVLDGLERDVRRAAVGENKAIRCPGKVLDYRLRETAKRLNAAGVAGVNFSAKETETGDFSTSTTGKSGLLAVDRAAGGEG